MSIECGRTLLDDGAYEDGIDFWGVLIGDVHRTEFQEIARWLVRRVKLKVFPCVAGAADLLRIVDDPPSLIVLLQSHPGQFGSDQVEPLRQLAPLARFLALLGSWCEGESRSGKPCPGILRAYWHQWQPRLEADLHRLRHGQCPLWGLPPTAAEEERYLTLSGIPLKCRQGLICVHAAEHESAASLMDVCKTGGYSAVWTKAFPSIQLSGVTAHLWDVPSSCPAALQDIGPFLQRLAPAPTVALLSYPRVEEKRQLLDAGVAAVVSKPYRIDDLLWELARVCGAHTNDLPVGIRH